MTIEELRAILSQSEGLKLDFKREYRLHPTAAPIADRQNWAKFINGQWDELIKDILALTNGNAGTVSQTAFLVIGAGDNLLPDGTRVLYDSSEFRVSAQTVLQKVNTACNPPIPDLQLRKVYLDKCQISVITILPSPHVHETGRQLKTTKGEFDDSGRLRFVRMDRIYSAHTVFVRRGEDIFPATYEERKVSEREKENLFRISFTPGSVPERWKDQIETFLPPNSLTVSSDMLPMMKRIYPQWLHPNLKSVRICHRDQRVLLEVTRQGKGPFSDPDIFDHTIAFDLGLIWESKTDRPFFGFERIANENAAKFVWNFSPYGMIMTGIGFHLFTSDGCQAIADLYESGYDRREHHR
jgi:hypothetical protein